MDPWTALERDDFIKNALNSTEQKGQKGYYRFNVYPKLSGISIDTEDIHKTRMTNALAHTVFMKNPEYRLIPLKFYDVLVQKIKTSAFVNEHFMSTFFVILKGSTAYNFLLQDTYVNDFPYSDMDIVIYINPFISSDLFNALRASLNSILLQVLSQYKRTIDHMLFLKRDNPVSSGFMNESTIEQFKTDLKTAFEEISDNNNTYITPFESAEIRNGCSKHSFVIRDSQAIENSVVRVEVPHFEKCERIPLRRTPLLASYNSSLNFKRENKIDADMKGEFDLYRLKLTCLHMSYDEEKNESKEHKISIDFIDVTIANKEDSELVDFWMHGRCIQLYETTTDIWVTLPDINTCLQDLYKMLFVYECPEYKREKRMRKYEIMQRICVNKFM